jgi:hypothetical protein
MIINHIIMRIVTEFLIALRIKNKILVLKYLPYLIIKLNVILNI